MQQDTYEINMNSSDSSFRIRYSRNVNLSWTFNIMLSMISLIIGIVTVMYSLHIMRSLFATDVQDLINTGHILAVCIQALMWVLLFLCLRVLFQLLNSSAFVYCSLSCYCAVVTCLFYWIYTLTDYDVISGRAGFYHVKMSYTYGIFVFSQILQAIEEIIIVCKSYFGPANSAN
jgi:hypothetical protein